MSGLAANRRLLDDDGICSAMRFSMCQDPALRQRPVGLIDPFLRTLALVGKNDTPVAALHFYASHPMVAYHRNMVSADVPGQALQYLSEHQSQETFNLYLTGCGGNVTFGKYFNGDKEESLSLLGQRLGQGMLANLQQLEARMTHDQMHLSTVTFDYPLAPEITEEAMLERVRKGIDGQPDRGAISRLIIARNWRQWQSCSVSRLTLDQDTHLLSLPGEMCVEYQLYAQSLVPEQLLACAAYGNGTYHYIPTAAMFTEGGYEPGASITTPAVEGLLQETIKTIMEPVIK